jgi:hypothetical protein
MDESVALTTIRGGINRLRTKGSPPEDSLYDLVNAYVTAAKTVKVRPGTLRPASVPGTKGLCAFDGALHVFAAAQVDVPDGYVLHIITHPDASPDDPIAIEEINFAAPFMQFLYVSATFVNGDTYHFWLQTGDTWQANTVYSLGDVVTPSVPNGLAFQAQRLTDPNLAWAPNVTRQIGDVVEPTVYNDYYYTVVDVQGDNPRSGATEPTWPTEDGAQVIEDADGAGGAPTTPTDMPDPNAQPSQSTSDRYDNGLGVFGRSVRAVSGS